MATSKSSSLPHQEMNHRFLQILPCVLFVFFPVILHSKKSCPISSCESNSFNLPVKYPFKLDTDRPLKNCQDYITLRCNDQGETMLDIPSYGEFIIYSLEYYSRSISLTDPDGCLPRRFMAKANLSMSPFEASYTDYTFYTCPRKAIETARIPYIKCMSDSTNVTVAITGSYFGSPLQYYGCEAPVNFLLPISPMIVNSYPVISRVFELAWNVSNCGDCSSFGGGESGDDDDSGSKWSKFFSSPIFIPSVVVLVAFFGLSCLLRVLKVTAGRHDNTETGNNTTNTNGTDTEPTTTTGATPAAPNEASNQSSKGNRPCTELIVVDDTHSTSLPNAETSCCSICLEDYQGKDTVRYLSQCGHYFHAHCVDQWLHRNTTCPVCRDKLSGYHL